MPAGGNVPELSVSDLSGALKRTVEERFGHVRLRGEVSNYRGPHSSGHAYFSLKDEGARIDAVVWRTAFARLKIKPEEGMEVIATGKVTTFPGKSSYQIVIESLEPAGVGALMAILEERRLRLAAEGLFDSARKRALPFLPSVIGVVTSPTGAVIRDILHRVAARFPRHVLVWPVRVQGEASGDEVAAAIRGFNALLDEGAVRRPHVIIVARGGGSLEDLWGFNDEAVVRAAAESAIPLVSAVGHETDWTLIDHAADLRAPTPTGAAELVLPVLLDLMGGTERLRMRHRSAIANILDRRNAEVRALSRHLPSGSEVTALPRQRLDRAATQMPATLKARHDRLRLALARATTRLASQSPHATMARTAQKIEGLRERLRSAGLRRMERHRAAFSAIEARLGTAFQARLRVIASRQAAERTRVAGLGDRLRRARDGMVSQRGRRLAAATPLLRSLGYKSVLARGYALVRDDGGQAVRSAAALQDLRLAIIEFADGSVTVQPAPGGDQAIAPARPSRGRKAPTAAVQPTLFEP
ncbi:exodeoxyribonuclease VII large subunit [Lichenihabitans sp. Uapishka_5]|nr:exodeoxyribonuclease VII large subunit [Lichenihabitans sp. Uapishka_5]MDX7949815.1 exodeoxyribonuclease VII large subunit [Lichenihabitans sp. Uapishka_5]